MAHGKKIISRIIGGLSVVLALSAKAQNAEAPPNVAAALVMKLAAFEQNLSSAGNLTIYVLGAPDVASELKKGIGKPIGGSVLKNVVSGAGLPAVKPSVLYVGSAGAAKNAVAYTQANKVLSMSGLPDLASRGVTLSFGIDGDGKPAIRLNLTSTLEENVVWNPAIMKVVTTVK